MLRPAIVSNVRLVAGGIQTIDVKKGDTKCGLSARWIVDASGHITMLPRKHGWWTPNNAHPTASAWSR